MSLLANVGFFFSKFSLMEMDLLIFEKNYIENDKTKKHSNTVIKSNRVERSGSGDLVEHGRASSRQASGVSSAQALEQFGSPASAHILVLVREVAVEFFVALVELVHGFFESASRHQLDI